VTEGTEEERRTVASSWDVQVRLRGALGIAIPPTSSAKTDSMGNPTTGDCGIVVGRMQGSYESPFAPVNMSQQSNTEAMRMDGLKPSITRIESGIRIVVHVVPNAKETKLQLETDGSLLMRVNAPPVKGKANRAITKWLSKRLRKPSSQIRIVTGLASNLKTLEITGIDEGDFLEAIGQR
jgi:uncharacterized protein (TIGR00251 family)